MIEREPRVAAQDRYDVVVVGGGIYGACVLLEAARRGLRALLIEREDFGGATSWNSLRILHGGLRYLQSLDLVRFRESVRERRWFCQNFPDLVKPLPCLMPLYGRGLKRPAAMRIALAINDWLSRDRNRDVRQDRQLPGGRMLDVRETVRVFPRVDQQGLRASALWHDAVMISPQRILIEILRWACSLGATALNYVEAARLLTSANKVVGVTGRDATNDECFDFRSETVINCAGPWSRQVAALLDRDRPSLFQPSLAFNVLLRRRPLSQGALAVQSKAPGSLVSFLLPLGDAVLAGTVHCPWESTTERPQPTEERLEQFLGELNLAVPGLELSLDDVIRVYAGLLPTTRQGSQELTKRPVIHDHSRQGGPRGLISVCGIKYTTARRVAERALRAANPKWASNGGQHFTLRTAASPTLDLVNPSQLFDGDEATVTSRLCQLIREESVIALDDLVLRRTEWGRDPQMQRAVEQRIHHLLGNSGVGRSLVGHAFGH